MKTTNKQLLSTNSVAKVGHFSETDYKKCYNE